MPQTAHAPQYFMALSRNNLIMGVVEAWPPQKLDKNQYPISREEYNLLRGLNTSFDLQTTIRMLQAIDKRLSKAPVLKKKGVKRK